MEELETTNDQKSKLEQEALKDSIVYKIHRTERLSGVFEQGKIYATVSEPISSDQLFNTCVRIKSRYKQYQNIIICLYKENEIGIEMAKNGLSEISANQKISAWIALYSFNKVEGEYFDDKPTEYLGG